MYSLQAFTRAAKSGRAAIVAATTSTSTRLFSSTTATATSAAAAGSVKPKASPLGGPVAGTSAEAFNVYKPKLEVYTDTSVDPDPSHETLITPEKVQERVARKYNKSPGAFKPPADRVYDAVIIGAGHNGLVTAGYLRKQGLDVLVLERRHVVGGAAVTEEIVPGFKFSRASYLAGLLRPQIIKDMNLEKYGFKYLPRDPSSFTPTLEDSPSKGKYLLMGSDAKMTYDSIAQFSVKDADAFPQYEDFLGKVREIVSPLLDSPPLDMFEGSFRERMQSFGTFREIAGQALRNKEVLVPFYELFTAPAAQILDRWFQGDVLKATLATDAVIGAAISPKHVGSAYVLLHHVMGEAAGKKGVWAYVRGGMGAVTQAMAASVREAGVTIETNATVKRIRYVNQSGGKPAKVEGVEMADGTFIRAKKVISNATPYHTFLELLPGLARATGAKEDSPLPPSFVDHIRFTDYACGAFKINCAVNKLPDFFCIPNDPSGKPGPQHHGTVHFEDKMDDIDNAYRESSTGRPASRPVIEMTIPSALDNTISPSGQHVVQLFVQYAPYEIDPAYGSWADEGFKNRYADSIFKIIDKYCKGFSESVIGRDVLSPLDLERIFGLQKGNIMHGALSLHQLAYSRPAPGFSRHRTPVEGLYICGSGAHPGGGVMGAAGRNCAGIVANDVAEGK